MDGLEHLFRRESGRLVAALVRVFGIHNLPLAEDVAQDALCSALEVWKFRGWPENPSAWLIAAAKRRAIDVLRRERTAKTFAPEMGRLLESEWTLVPSVEELFKYSALEDDGLRMMFSCCHPRLTEEARVGLILNILCGFGIDEVAAAFLSSRASVEKRLQRAKRVLATSRRLFDLADADEVSLRLPTVQRALYLLFNEGYHGAGAESVVRAELCQEAIRLTSLLLRHPRTSVPGSFALLAMMCLHAARLPGRVDGAGGLTPWFEQDRSLWDAALVEEGERLLDRSAQGDELTQFHLEAALASVHARARTPADTDWTRMVRLYDRLLELHPSPVVALNRAIAVAQAEGPEAGLRAIEAISEEDRQRLARYPFFPAALGEFESRRGQLASARAHFQSALELARNPSERRHFEQRINALPEMKD